MLKISENNQSSLTIRCFEFYNSFLEYLNSINKQNNKIEYDILNPLNEYISHIKTQNSLIFSEFKDIINETYKQKKIMNKVSIIILNQVEKQLNKKI